MALLYWTFPDIFLLNICPSFAQITPRTRGTSEGPPRICGHILERWGTFPSSQRCLPDRKKISWDLTLLTTLHILTDSLFSFDDDLDLIGEDDGDDLLCDFAPNVFQADGCIGLIAGDGSLVKPTLSKSTGSSWNTSATAKKKASVLNRARFAASRQFQGFAKFGYDGIEEPCLSDSWHFKTQVVAQMHPPGPADSSDSSITALRQQYHKVFGKETSSNNRQWLLRRLAEMSTFVEEDVDCEEGDRPSNRHNRDGPVAAPRLSPPSAIETNDYVSVIHGRNHSMKWRGAGKQGTQCQKFAESNTVGRSACQVKAIWKGPNTSKRGRGDNNSQNVEGGIAKADGSSAGKKIKKGQNSDTDSAGEPPVKSGNSLTSNNCKAGQARKNSDTIVGWNGRRSKHHNPWALEEAEALVEGVSRCGGGKWADIKKLGFPAIEHRTAVDLKDKWRNLLRIAMLPHQPVKSVGDKKREIPSELLSRVRELAAKQAKKQAQDGRTRHGH